MRAIYIYWTFIILLTVSSGVFAQKSATAVMNVSVTVVSGATISEVQGLEINFDAQEVQSANFSFNTSNQVDTYVASASTFTVTNQYGESITMEADDHIQDQNDVRSVNIGTKFSDTQQDLRGQYQGNLTTTIAYF